MKTLILAIALLSGCATDATVREIMYYQSLQGQGYHQSYQQQRNNDLYMQSGTTGCTPNFSTGVCK